jgi:hypothetical protein
MDEHNGGNGGMIGDGDLESVMRMMQMIDHETRATGGDVERMHKRVDARTALRVAYVACLEAQGRFGGSTLPNDFAYTLWLEERVWALEDELDQAAALAELMHPTVPVEGLG